MPAIIQNAATVTLRKSKQGRKPRTNIFTKNNVVPAAFAMPEIGTLADLTGDLEMFGLSVETFSNPVTKDDKTRVNHLKQDARNLAMIANGDESRYSFHISEDGSSVLMKRKDDATPEDGDEDENDNPEDEDDN